MNYMMIILRLVHIFSSVLWVGTTFAMVLFISKTAEAVGKDSAAFMAHFTQKSGLSTWMAAASGLTLLSGLWMYYIVIGPVPDYSIGRDLALTLGSLAGIIAFVMGMRMGGLTRKMKAEKDPKMLAALSAKMSSMAASGAILMVIALAGMTLSEYFAF